MKHFMALLIKFVVILIILAVIQAGLFAWPMSTVVITSILLTLVAYLVGDLWILPIGSNLTASSADFGISLILIWGLGSLLLMGPLYSISPFFSALTIAICEWFFHVLVMPKVFHLKPKGTSPAR